MPSASEMLVLLYLSLMAWFFFWLSPRVNDGRLQQMIDKFVENQIDKRKDKK